MTHLTPAERRAMRRSELAEHVLGGAITAVVVLGLPLVALLG